MTQIFRTNVPGKTQCGKTGATALEGFIIMQNLNTTFWPLEMDFPTEKLHGSSTLSLGDKKYG